MGDWLSKRNNVGKCTGRHAGEFARRLALKHKESVAMDVSRVNADRDDMAGSHRRERRRYRR